MDSIVLFINAFLFSALAFFFWQKKSVNTLAKLSALMYAFIALCTLFFSYKGAYETNGLRLWPFIVYFVVFFLFMLPYVKAKSLVERFTINNIHNANLMANGYIICCIIQIFLSFNKTINAIRGGDYLYIYLSREDVNLYDNFFEQVVVNVVNYFFIPMVLYGFYVLAHKVNYRFKWFLLIIPFVASAMYALSYASRTEFFVLLLIYGSAYFMFSKYFSKKINKLIAVWGIAFSVVIGLGSTVITQSRFESDDEGSWVSGYFGDSNLIAHDTFVYTTQYSEGTYFFRNIVPLFGIKPINTKCSVDHGFGFRPMISTRFSDFGPIGFIIDVLFCMCFLSYFLYKKKISWGTISIVFYFYKCLTLGALYENNNEISWLYVLIVAFILDFLTDKKYGKNNSVLSPTVSSYTTQ